MKNEDSTTMSLVIVLLIILMSACSFIAFGQSKITNKDIVEMTKAGLGSEVIINSINTLEPDFDLSPSALIVLGNAKVASSIIRAMQSKMPAIGEESVRVNSGTIPINRRVSVKKTPIIIRASEPGFYLVRGDNQLEQIPVTAFEGVESGKGVIDFFKKAIKVKHKAILSGGRAAVEVNNNPNFIYVTNDGSSPAKFVALHMEQDNNKRGAVVGDIGAFTGNHASFEGVQQFSFEKVGTGHYKITFSNSLETGQYCFYEKGQIQKSDETLTANGLVYDFGVK